MRPAFVAMMQSADFPELNDPAGLQILNGSRFRGILIQRQMRPPPMIIAKIIFKQSAQMVLIDHDHMIQALATNATVVL
jgi:hypothetical protein